MTINYPTFVGNILILKKAFSILALVFASLLVGFFVGQNIDPIEKIKIVKETRIDTVFKSRVVEIEVEKPVKHVDTVFIVSEAKAVEGASRPLDTAIVQVQNRMPDDALQIKRDLMIKSDTLRVVMITPEIEDTLQARLLGVKPVKQGRILLEYWESPLNYQGYKLSKSKLVVYGVLPIKINKLYKHEKAFYLKVDDLFYRLIETNTFENIVAIDKPKFIYD